MKKDRRYTQKRQKQISQYVL